MPESSNVKLIVVDDPIPGKTVGGVQLLSRVLAKTARARGLEVVICPTEEVLDLLDENSETAQIVFLQRAGSLSPAYELRAQAWLLRGAQVFEENVFVRASRYRPRDPSYRLVLMSMDGANRYSLRSFAALTRKHRRAVILPNPILLDVDRKVRNAGESDGKITFLRVGRPDPIKWSNFEREFCSAMARAGDVEVELIRVGYPGPPGVSKDGGFTLRDLPYSSSPGSLYSEADVYIHHSRIGETFGNTLAEASRAGMRVVLAVDLAWDSASVGFLDRERDIIGTPRGLIRSHQRVLRILRDGDRELGGRISADVDLPPEAFLDVILAVVRGDENDRDVATPSVRASLRYFLALRRELKEFGSAPSIPWTLLREVVRAQRQSRIMET